MLVKHMVTGVAWLLPDMLLGAALAVCGTANVALAWIVGQDDR